MIQFLNAYARWSDRIARAPEGLVGAGGSLSNFEYIPIPQTIAGGGGGLQLNDPFLFTNVSYEFDLYGDSGLTDEDRFPDVEFMPPAYLDAYIDTNVLEIALELLAQDPSNVAALQTINEIDQVYDAAALDAITPGISARAANIQTEAAERRRAEKVRQINLAIEDDDLDLAASLTRNISLNAVANVDADAAETLSIYIADIYVPAQQQIAQDLKTAIDTGDDATRDAILSQNSVYDLIHHGGYEPSPTALQLSEIANAHERFKAYLRITGTAYLFNLDMG